MKSGHTGTGVTRRWGWRDSKDAKEVGKEGLHLEPLPLESIGGGAQSCRNFCSGV
jgi:hypothetical protein